MPKIIAIVYKLIIKIVSGVGLKKNNQLNYLNVNNDD